MEETLKTFEESLDAIERLKDVQETLLIEPISKRKWSIREIIGHLYYWDKYNLETMVPKMAKGANLPQFPNHDEHNMEAIAYLRDYSVESIIDAFLKTRKELIESISEVEEDVRFTIGKDKRQFSVESFIKIFVKHDIHHLQQILSKLNQ